MGRQRKPHTCGEADQAVGEQHKARHKDFELAQKVMTDAETKDGKLDWAKTKKIFGKHSTLRDGFGAGWWAATTFNHDSDDFSKFLNISKADKAAILAYAIQHLPPTLPAPTAGVGQRLDHIKC